MLKKGWVGDAECIYIGNLETVNHLFIHCPIAKEIWNWIAQ
jgi:zinc-binding in reverse transcriptase